MSFVVDVTDGVCRFSRSGARFLSTGFDGGVRVADAAYNVTVPEGWGDGGTRDLRSYVRGRASDAELPMDPDDPALLTGVDQRHARIARLGGTVVVATAGISNPATLPVKVDGDWTAVPDARRDASTARRDAANVTRDASDVHRDPPDDDRPGLDRHPPVGTVNLLVGTDRNLAPGALANLVAVAAEAKAATLLAATGFPGTTSDAIVVASASGGEPAEFSGSSTVVGETTRACVRDALLASLRSRYENGGVPASVAEAEYGVVTDRRADVSPVER